MFTIRTAEERKRLWLKAMELNARPTNTWRIMYERHSFFRCFVAWYKHTGTNAST